MWSFYPGISLLPTTSGSACSNAGSWRTSQRTQHVLVIGPQLSADSSLPRLLPNPPSPPLSPICHSLPPPQPPGCPPVLRQVSLAASPGQVLAVIGPSGSGKSTLLDAMAGRISPTSLSGALLLNGQPLNAASDMRRVSAYVMQVRAGGKKGERRGSLLRNMLCSISVVCGAQCGGLALALLRFRSISCCFSHSSASHVKILPSHPLSCCISSLCVRTHNLTRALLPASTALQDDALFSLLSVRETLLFSARLRLPARTTAQQRLQRVDAVIRQLRLTACADTRIGSTEVRQLAG